MITQLFKIDFLATECRQGNLNILRAASQRVAPKNRLIAIRQPYNIVLDKNTNDTLNGRFEPKSMSRFILLNSYHVGKYMRGIQTLFIHVDGKNLRQMCSDSMEYRLLQPMPAHQIAHIP